MGSVQGTMHDNYQNCIILPLKFQALFFPLHESGWINERVLLSQRRPVHCNASVLQKSEFHLLLLIPMNREIIFSSRCHDFTLKNFVLYKCKAAVSKVVLFLAKSFSKQMFTLSGRINPELCNPQTLFTKNNPHYKAKIRLQSR